MIDHDKPRSQLQIALGGFSQNRLAVACSMVLLGLYLSAIFAEFLSPYTFEQEDRNYSFCPPMAVQVVDEKGQWRWPFVYGRKIGFDQFHKRVYTTDYEAKYPLRFFHRGEKYKWLGLIPCDRHLWGVGEPGKIYIWGADSRGRDLFSRILYGGRVSLSIGLIGVLISFPIGLLVGGIAGYCGGRTDDILMRICEVVMMLPGFYILLALRAIVPANFNSVQIYFSIIVILSFISWAGLARIIRGMCLSLKEREFVLAARVMGLSDWAIVVKHILPHTLSYSIIAVMLSIPGYILGESALSLIGLGIIDPFTSWGNLLSDAMSVVQIHFAPWVLLPGIFILVTIVCFNVIGDVLRDCLDPLYKGEKN